MTNVNRLPYAGLLAAGVAVYAASAFTLTTDYCPMPELAFISAFLGSLAIGASAEPLYFGKKTEAYAGYAFCTTFGLMGAAGLGYGLAHDDDFAAGFSVILMFILAAFVALSRDINAEQDEKSKLQNAI